MKMPEQDVFIQSTEDKTKVMRMEGDVAAKPETQAIDVYATKTVTLHDPFKLSTAPLGPFEKGKRLGFTLGEWLAATGKGTYTLDGEKAEVSLTFEKLVSNGVYTVWCSRITFPPNAAVVDKPCGATDGSENKFVADESGNGTIYVKFFSPLEESTKETVSSLVLVYHSDGKTYGASPGDFGLNSHVQLVYLLPAKEVVAEPTQGTAGTAADSSRLGLFVIVIILISGGAWWLKKRTPIGLVEEESTE